MDIKEIKQIKEETLKRLNMEAGVDEWEFVDALKTIVNLCEENIKDKQDLIEIDKEYNPYREDGDEE